MGLRQTQHNTTHEPTKIIVGVVLQEFVTAQLAGAGPTGEDAQLVSAILNRGREAIDSATFKVVSDDGITPDSDDATIRAAVNQASTKTHLLWALGIRPTP